MKRTLALTIFLIASLAAFAGTTSTNTSFNVSAYKNPELPALNYTIHVSYLEASEITGFSTVFDISDKMKNSRTLSKAFVITISSNLKTAIPVEIKFTPFINQRDNSTIPVSYVFTKETSAQVEGDETVYTKISTISNKNRTYYFRYTATTTLKNASGMEITELLVSESNTIATLSHYIATKQAKNGYSWTNFDFTNMVSSSETLPGFSPTQNLTTTSYFALSMTEANYNAMASNVEYLATVTLTITSL